MLEKVINILPPPTRKIIAFDPAWLGALPKLFLARAPFFLFMLFFLLVFL
jgi:hypothetical protein